jgi:hypothetical protein
VALQTVTKQVSEQFVVGVEFFNRLPPNNPSISSATASAIKVSDSSDATATVLQSTTCTISGTQVRCGVKGGANGIQYKITLSVTLSDNSILEEDFYLQITNT